MPNKYDKVADSHLLYSNIINYPNSLDIPIWHKISQRVVLRTEYGVLGTENFFGRLLTFDY